MTEGKRMTEATIANDLRKEVAWYMDLAKPYSNVIASINHSLKRLSISNPTAAIECINSTRNALQETLLHWAVKEGQTEIIILILKIIPVQDRLLTLLATSFTPLHTAATENQLEPAGAILCEFTASEKVKLLTAIDDNGCRAIDYAIENNNRGIVKLLRKVENMAKSGKPKGRKTWNL